MSNKFKKFFRNYVYICPKCKQEVERGIVSISTHWAECEGKEFKKALIEERNKKGSALTEQDVDILRNKYLNL